MGMERKTGKKNLGKLVREELAFTLVELMVTVSILAILATVAIPMYSNYVNRAKQSDAIIGLKAAQMAEEQYYSENNVYCNTIDMLPGFRDGTIDDSYLKGKYRVKVIRVTTVPGFVVAATWVDSSKNIADRWTISNTNINPVHDTLSTPWKKGINEGYSVFDWLFD